jgi:uncharacterized protein YuzE
MRFEYDKEVNAEYPYPRDIPPGVAGTTGLADSVYLDLDAEDHVLGIDRLVVWFTDF